MHHIDHSHNDLASLISQLSLQNANNITGQSKHIFVNILFTKSTANDLNINAHKLNGIKVADEPSAFYVLRGNHQSSSEHYKDVNVAFSRNVEMTESSTSVYGMDDLSEEYTPDEDEPEEPKFYLLPELVHTKSLMFVSSLAHDGNLDTRSDKIVVNVYDGEESALSSETWIDMCRICHGGESYEELLGPCKCRGSIELAHRSCLERWLRESQKSNCELCHHHYDIQRHPKYGVLQSILIWLRNPGPHGPYLIDDLISFCLYTPASIFSTYILMYICESASRNITIEETNIYAHITAFFAIAGLAAIDFTYSSWIMMSLHRHVLAWRSWYREHCCLTLILPPNKRPRHRPHIEVGTSEVE